MSHKNRIAAKVDANQPDIVSNLRDIPGVSVEVDHDDILIGCQHLTFWFEIKDERALDNAGNIKESEIKPSQKKLRAEWKGHYKIVSSFEQIIEDMNKTFRKFGLRVIKL